MAFLEALDVLSILSAGREANQLHQEPVRGRDKR